MSNTETLEAFANSHDPIDQPTLRDADNQTISEINEGLLALRRLVPEASVADVVQLQGRQLIGDEPRDEQARFERAFGHLRPHTHAKQSSRRWLFFGDNSDETHE